MEGAVVVKFKAVCVELIEIGTPAESVKVSWLVRTVYEALPLSVIWVALEVTVIGFALL